MSNTLIIPRVGTPKDALRVTAVACLAMGFVKAPPAACAPRVRTM